MRTVIESLFTEHPASVGESYGQHLTAASRTGITLIAAGCAALIHGLAPCCFQTTASTTIMRLCARMRQRFPARFAAIHGHTRTRTPADRTGRAAPDPAAPPSGHAADR